MNTLGVPLEIAQPIFTACLTDTPLHPNEAPLLLTRVCREWRHVALTTPSLWTTLHIPNKTRPIPLRTWLDLSQSMPIDFDIDFASRDTPLDIQDSYMELLCTYASRWRKARFVLRSEVPTSMLAHWLRSESLDLLCSLQICYHPSQAVPIRFGSFRGPADTVTLGHSHTFGEMLSASPSLRTLRLDDDNTTLDCLRTLHSQSLRDLTISLDLANAMDSMNALERCFASCPNISSLSTTFFPDTRSLIITPPIERPNIRNLQITTTDTDTLVFFLNKFWTPNLETLSLTVFHTFEEGLSSSYVRIEDLFLSCSSTLRKLSIGLDSKFYRPPVAAIAALSNLTSLTLRDIADPALLVGFFKTMTLRFAPSGQLCPSQNIALQHIALDVHGVMVQYANNPRREEVMKNFFVAVVDMVLSRYKLPDNATTFDGQSQIRALREFQVGDTFADVYQRRAPGQWAEVVQGWKDMEGVVRFASLPDDEDWMENSG